MKYKRQHDQSYTVINSSSLYCHGKTEAILNYMCTFGLTEGESTSVMHNQIQVSVNSTGGIVHLFIGTGRSLYEFTFMPFIFTIDLWTTRRGLIAFSPLSRFLFAPLSRNSLARSFGATSAFVTTMLFTSCMLLTRVRRYLLICYTWKTLLNHVFEDLRKTKAPNSSPLQY
jgi:hypothetical protein